MNQLIMIFLISLLILVHEIGHFIAARLCGVRITRFGIGMPFGPSWKMFKIGHTSFYLHAFLFGGYVAFADDEENLEKMGVHVIAEKLFKVEDGYVRHNSLKTAYLIFSYLMEGE